MERKSTVESVAGQLAFSRKKAAEARYKPDATAVLKRSEGIYRQTVDICNKTRHKLWVFFPAFLMGFKADL